MEVAGGEEEEVEGAFWLMECGVVGGGGRDGDGDVVRFEGGFCRGRELV